MIHFNGAAWWLFGFGLIPAIFAFFTQLNKKNIVWYCGAIISIIGAGGVFGLENAIFFFIAWELMSFGTAIMLLSEHKESNADQSVFFMLAILEVGAIALLMAFLLLSNHGHSFSFSSFALTAKTLSASKQILIGILLLIGFGAKLGLLPFYEWLPNAYSAGTGATGAIASGIILNAAFYGLMRGLCVWLPSTLSLGIIIIVIAGLTAVFTILHAFQQSDWRKLLSFSSAENAAISVLMLGVVLLFQHEHQMNYAALAATVALIHLAGHSLSKGAMFLTADGVCASTGNYRIAQNGLLKKGGVFFGLGALFAAMSLCAMPPQIGFVSEWYVFQTLFHGFYLTGSAERLTIIFGGVCIAATAAIALATFVKLFGIGLLGAPINDTKKIPRQIKGFVFLLGILILSFAVGLFFWINALAPIIKNWFQFNAPSSMHTALLLVPLSANFAFISPTLLIIVGPLLALLPILLIIFNLHYEIKKAPVWTGGTVENQSKIATTSLTFSNALRHFYSFIYLPKQEIKLEYEQKKYFVKTIQFQEKTTPVFTKYLFQPVVKFIIKIAEKIRLLQSGNLNFYNFIIGALFFIILLSVFW